MGRGPRSEPVPELARGLRALRLRAGLSQDELAARVRAAGGGLSRAYYQQIESGRRHPSPDMRRAILATLGADDGALRAAIADAPPTLRAPGPLARAAPAAGAPPPGADRRAATAEPLRALRDIARTLDADDLHVLVEHARFLAARAAGRAGAPGPP